MLRTRNNTDSNKVVIFSGIASYYGDNYILAEEMKIDGFLASGVRCSV